jgi:hypothetical protein
VSKSVFTSKIDYRKDPEWADWSFWDKYGNPMPDPKEVAALRANACPPIDDLAAYMEQLSSGAKEVESGKS